MIKNSQLSFLDSSNNSTNIIYRKDNNIKTFNPNIFLCSIKNSGTEYKMNVKKYNGDNTLDFSDTNSKSFTLYDENNEPYTSIITLE